MEQNSDCMFECIYDTINIDAINRPDFQIFTPEQISAHLKFFQQKHLNQKNSFMSLCKKALLLIHEPKQQAHDNPQPALYKDVKAVVAPREEEKQAVIPVRPKTVNVVNGKENHGFPVNHSKLLESSKYDECKKKWEKDHHKLVVALNRDEIVQAQQEILSMWRLYW